MLVGIIRVGCVRNKHSPLILPFVLITFAKWMSARNKHYYSEYIESHKCVRIMYVNGYLAVIYVPIRKDFVENTNVQFSGVRKLILENCSASIEELVCSIH